MYSKELDLDEGKHFPILKSLKMKFQSFYMS